MLKTPIPGTDWLKVTTTGGNIFYSHKIRKESVWNVPDELKSALEAFQGREDEIGASSSSEPSSKAKRKADQTSHMDEATVNKKAKVVEEDSDSEDGSEDDGGEEEEWQREAAQQLAKEAEDERKRLEDLEKEAREQAKQTQENLQFAIPDKVDLSLEEGKALFKVCALSSRVAEPYGIPDRDWDFIDSRPCFGKKISTLCTLGTRLFQNLFQILDTFFFRLSLHDERHLMNIAKSAVEKYGNRPSRKRRKQVTPRMNLIDSFKKMSKAQGLVGLTSGVHGRKIDGFMGGAETIGSEKEDSETF